MLRKWMCKFAHPSPSPAAQAEVIDADEGNVQICTFIGRKEAAEKAAPKTREYPAFAGLPLYEDEAKARQVAAGGWQGNQYTKPEVALGETLPQAPDESESEQPAKRAPKATEEAAADFGTNAMTKDTYHRHSKQARRDRRWPPLRLEAKRRDGWKCVQCGARGRLEVDHIRPVRDAPDLAFDLANLQTMCVRCHARKTLFDIGLQKRIPHREKWLECVEELCKGLPHASVTNDPAPPVGDSPATGARRRD